MTLVELLVVVIIIGLLLAVSVPLLRPMLDSRKTAGGAQVLAGAFQQARMKSIQEGTSQGLVLIPYDTAKSVSVQLRLQKSGSSFGVVNHPLIRVKVVNGEIQPWFFNESVWKWQEYLPTATPPAGVPSRESVMAPFEVVGARVQFNRVGRFFAIGASAKLKSPYHDLNLPGLDVMNDDAMEYYVFSVSAASNWVPQVVMPRGTVVDIVFSGGETLDFEGDLKAGGVGDGIPACFEFGDEVIVMFSPAGYVDSLLVNGQPYKVNEMLYFCVGEWDRQVDANRQSLAKDKKSNLDVPATFWVTIHPKTGEIRIAENAPIPASVTWEGRINDARKFAREHFFNVGGF